LNLSQIERNDKLHPLVSSAVLVAATLICSFLVTHAPRSSSVWLITLFFCWVEALYGILIVYRRTLGPKLSGAMSAVIFTTVGGYTAISLASVITYVATRDSSGDQDPVIFGILLFEAVALFGVLQVLVVRDKIDVATSMDEERIHAVRVEASERIATARALLDICQRTSLEEQRRIESVSKRLYAAQCALSHSHNPEVTPSADAEIHAVADALHASASTVKTNIPILGIVSEMEQQLFSLETILRRNRIS
jgi:hypothetical protein